MNESHVPAQNHYEKHLYGVIYLDILGQKELMKRLELENASPEDEAEMQKVLGHIELLLAELKTLKDYLSPENAKVIFNSIFDESLRSLLGDIQEKDVRESLEEAKFGIQQFSDTTMLYMKLDGIKPFMMYYVFGALICRLSDILINTFAKGIFIRGAITSGMAWEIGENNLYGPVIRDAYILEEQTAQWPRVIVSESVISLYVEDIKRIVKIVSKDSLICRLATCQFIRGVDGIAQLALLPSTYLFLVAQGSSSVQRQMKLNQLLEINKNINANIDSTLKEMDNKAARNLAELSKIIIRYKLLKKELLRGIVSFASTCDFCENQKKQQGEAVEKYLSQVLSVLESDRHNDIDKLASQEEILATVAKEFDIQLQNVQNDTLTSTNENCVYSPMPASALGGRHPSDLGS